jgi:hypothetical protein
MADQQTGPAGWSTTAPQTSAVTQPSTSSAGPSGWTATPPGTQAPPVVQALTPPPGTTASDALSSGTSLVQGVLNPFEGLANLPGDISAAAGGPSYDVRNLPGLSWLRSKAKDPISEGIGETLPFLFGGEAAGALEKGAAKAPSLVRAAAKPATKLLNWMGDVGKGGGIYKSFKAGAMPTWLSPGSLEERGERALVAGAIGAPFGLGADFAHWFGPQLREEFMQQRIAQIYKQIGEPGAPPRVGIFRRGLTSQPSRATNLETLRNDVGNAIGKADIQLGLSKNPIGLPGWQSIRDDNEVLGRSLNKQFARETPFAIEFDKYVRGPLAQSNGVMNGLEFKTAMQNLRMREDYYRGVGRTSPGAEQTADLLRRSQDFLMNYADGPAAAKAASKNARNAYVQTMNLVRASGGSDQASLPSAERLLNEMKRTIGPERWATWSSPDRTFAEQNLNRSGGPPWPIRALTHAARHHGMPVPFVHGEAPPTIGAPGRVATELGHAGPRFSPLVGTLGGLLYGPDQYTPDSAR